MEKKTDETIGSVRIADDVVAMIAGIAATEVEGVFSMAGNITNELMSRVGMNKLSKGVKVEMMGKRVHVDLAVVLEYGRLTVALNAPFEAVAVHLVQYEAMILILVWRNI